MPKKEAAIVLGLSGNIAFSAGTLLLGIKKHLKKQVDIIIFCSADLSVKDRKILQEILPCEFITYEFPKTNEANFQLLEKFKYSLLVFSRYECFKLLTQYKKVLWLDTDILIQSDFSEIFNNDSIAPEGFSLFLQKGSILRHNFSEPVEGYDLDREFYNSGVILFKDTFPNPVEACEWCYKKTSEWANKIAMPDQAIINLLIQEQSLKVDSLEEKYNAHPRVYRHLGTRAAIVHAHGSKKFWNQYSFADWNSFYAQWIALGGSPYSGSVSSYLKRLFKMLSLSMPPSLRRPKDFFKHF